MSSKAGKDRTRSFANVKSPEQSKKERYGYSPGKS